MDKNSTTEDYRDRTRWSESPYLILKGFLMGAADIVPGVSGGTLALITGIYHRLIYAIKSVDTRTVKNLFTLRFNKVFEYFHWKFLLLLFTGIVLAIIFFTRVVPLQIYMFTHPELVYGIFFGLILGSVFLLLAELDSSSRNLKAVLPLFAGTAIGFGVVTMVPAETPESFWYIFASGAVAICAMILPGISGSYILLIFRKYDYILSQLGAIGSEGTLQAVLNLTPFIIGAAAGLILFSRLLSWLLSRYYSVTLLVLIGFLLGSLYVIWPYQEREFDEIVRNVEVLPYDDPLVQRLQERGEIPQTPKYKRVGEVIQQGDEQEVKLVEVETISRKLIQSTPFFPWADREVEHEQVRRGYGLTGITLGLFMIVGIAYLRKKSPNR